MAHERYFDPIETKRHGSKSFTVIRLFSVFVEKVQREFDRRTR